MNNLLNLEANNEEEAPIRPIDFSDFTGQSKTIENLSIYIRAAKKRGEPLDHVLFYGPPGLGKTTLSRIISNEMGVNLVSISSPSIQKPGDLVSVLVSIQKNDVLFLDEIHRLPKIVEEVLYSAMEDYKVTIMVGNDHNSTPVEININPFTLVAATTRKGMLSQPLLDRFGIQFRMDYYEPKDLFKIVKRASLILGVNISDEGILEIAKRSRGTPRIALKILRRIRDFIQHDEIFEQVQLSFIEKCLGLLNISENGLDELDRRYLTVLTDNFRGGPVGLEPIAMNLSESKETLEWAVEPYLIRQNLIVRTPRGRMLASKITSLLSNDDQKKLF